MLELDDPLWRKLDDAHRDRDIPKLLSELAEAWDDEAANSLFWDCLCHQGTCYGATYASIPHLLRIAQPPHNLAQRREVALFLGNIIIQAFVGQPDFRGETGGRTVQGLPESLEAWDRKLDCFRGLVDIFENPARPRSPYEQNDLLPRYKKLLEVGSVAAGDPEKIETIRAEFFSALPTIKALCERTLLENLSEDATAPYLLSGIAAADGLLNLARLLSSGREGQCQCASCGWKYEYLLFGDRVAIYVGHDPRAEIATPFARRAVLDYKDDAPIRADSFLAPIADSRALDARAATLLSLAVRTQSRMPAVLLGSFLGTMACAKCGARGPVTSI